MVSFKLLETFLENTTLNLIIKKTSTGIVVSVLPIANVDDKAKENLIPLIIKGTAEELDQEFMQLIQPELTSVTGIISNVAEFEAHAKEMKDKSEAEKNAKESKKKANETSKKALEGAEKLLEEEKYDECQKAIDKALENNAEYKPAITLQNKLNKAKPEDNQVDIFNVIEEETAEPTKKESPKEPNVIINKVEKPQIEGKPTPTHIVDDVPNPIKTPSQIADEHIPTTPNTLQQVNPNSGERIGAPVQLGDVLSQEDERAEEIKMSLQADEEIAKAIQEQPPVTLTEIQDKVVSEIKEKKEEAINQQTISNEKPTRADFESTESYDNRLKMWEESQKIQQGLDEINEIADASPNIEVVSLPPQTPKPIEPNNSFDNEVKADYNPFKDDGPIIKDPNISRESGNAGNIFNDEPINLG